MPSAVAGEVPPLPPRLVELVGLASLGEARVLEPGERWVDPSADELPEVQALAPDGWRPLVEDGMSWLLPALWPSRHRCWVPDRLPRMMTSVRIQGLGIGAQSEIRTVEAWSEAVYADLAEEQKEMAADCGLPAPPRGRLWLLRSPWPTLGLEPMLSMMPRRCSELGFDWDLPGYFKAARELLSWTEAQVWLWWDGPQADAARAWEQLGRVGQDVAGLVVAALGPASTARLTAPVGGGGAGLSEQQALAWAEAVRRPDTESLVKAITSWRALGLPADPPEDDHWVLEEMAPAVAGDWLADGFSFEDVGVWLGVSLESARMWRDYGFTPAQARALLAADSTVTPAEAVTFDEIGIDADTRLGWVEAGFTAAQARTWTEVDILASEARVWRSMGRSVDAVGRHRAAGGAALPDDLQVGGFAFGPNRADRNYGVADPPGTRGRIATESSRDNGHP